MRNLLYILLLFITISPIVKAQDITPPDTPELQYVTVDPFTDEVTIVWNLSDSLDTEGYLIFRKEANWEFIDSVKNPYLNTYIDYNADPNLHPELYRIAAYDSTGNPSPMTAITPIDESHNTIYIFPHDLNDQNCVESAKIAFNQYQYWSEGIGGYKIYRTIQDSNNYVIVDTLSASSVAYYDTDIISEVSYCYYIEAYSNLGKISRSNYTCRAWELSDTIKYINADYATVADYNLIDISFTVDTSGENVSYFKLFSSSDTNGTYSLLETFNYSLYTKILYSEYLNINNEVKYYKLIAYNKCNQEVCESNLAHNILLEVNHGGDLIHNLLWNGYSTWLGGVENIEVYRIDVDKTIELIANLLSSSTYTNDISNYLGQKASGNFCYYIVTKEDDTNPYNIKGESRSNIACIEEKPIVWMPNIFTPDNDGSNDVFQPFVSFASPLDYVFQIYDRWGNVIFETNNPTDGWDGKSGNKYSKEGTYVYYIKFTTALNNIFEQRGLLTLMIK